MTIDTKMLIYRREPSDPGETLTV